MKTALIGLDGATLELIKPWVEEGHLPNIKKIMESGSYGSLHSTVPPVTVPAFPSLYTGMTPNNMGVWGWKEIDLEKKMLRSVNITKLKAKRLWEILSENGLRSVWLNIPTTFPTSEFDGWMVTGLATPDINSEFTYPHELRDEIFDVVPDYNIHPGFYYKGDNEDAYLKEVNRLLDNRFTLAKHLWENKPWDLFVMLFRSPDNITHFIWPTDDENEKKVLDIHKKLDNYLGWFLEKDDVNVIVFSDHGFLNMKYAINPNKLLKDNGLLHLKKRTGGLTLKKKILAWIKEKAKEITRKYDMMSFVKKFVSQDFIDSLPNSGNPSIFELVDWNRSKAFASREAKAAMIYLKPGLEDREATIKEIKKIFNDFAETNDIEIDFIEPNEGPDLVMPVYKKYYDISGSIDSEEVIEERMNSTHDYEGILFAKGPDIGNRKIDNAYLYDLTPTVLHMFDLPIPKYMNGKVLTDLFSPDSEISKREPKIESAKDEMADKVIGDLLDSGKI